MIGPLLFLIYINDLPDTINPHVLTSLFADDARLSNSFKLHVTNNMQEALNSLCKWMFDWELERAPSKCVVMIIGYNDHPPPPVYSLNGVLLPVVKQLKDLGITFCDNLSFNIHINSICSKAYILINRICRCFITNDYVFLLQAYISYVRPILEYNSSIWNPHTNYIGNAKAL